MRRQGKAPALGGRRRPEAARALAALAFAAAVALPRPAGASGGDDARPAEAGARAASGAGKATAIPWRRDPSVPRHPGSYIGGAIGYSRAWAWIPENDRHGDLAPGPFDSMGMAFGVGDAFTEWFALGFRIQIASGRNGDAQYGSFGLLLDATFYPAPGLGLRPAVGLGFGYATGEHDWEVGGGGPGCLALGVLYEIRLARLITLAPVVQGAWITGEGFDGATLFVGLELTKWFMTATN